MLTAVKNQMKVSLLSIKYALQREMLNKVTFISNIIFMILNNSCFIIQWLLLYSIRNEVGGYTFKKILIMWALAAGTYGIAHFFFKDVFDLSETINTGKLDAYLIQPKNVLISCITSSVEVSALGDLLYSYIMLLFFGFSLKNFLFLTFFNITGGLILVSIAIIVGSLSFWFGRVETLANTLNSQTTNLATYPEGIYKGLVKIIFYTIVPIGFINFIPINIISSFNLIELIIIITACIAFISIAFIVFYKGLKRYCSSNLMNVRM